MSGAAPRKIGQTGLRKIVPGRRARNLREHLETISGFRAEAEDFGRRVSSLGFRAEDFGLRVSSLGVGAQGSQGELSEGIS